MQERIGYTFRDAQLLEQALTHPSFSARAGKKQISNQRLEFLGDAVLGMLVAEMLYGMYPAETEGDLAKRQAMLISGAVLVRVAKAAGLGEALRLAPGEDARGGRTTPSNLEDACEALIGALYLDGGAEAARGFVLHYWKPIAHADAAPPRDAKTALQEWAQARGLPLPAYHIAEQEGPAHAPEFTIEVCVEGYAPARATARSRRQAEHAAAQHLLSTLPEGGRI